MAMLDVLYRLDQVDLDRVDLRVIVLYMVFSDPSSPLHAESLVFFVFFLAWQMAMCIFCGVRCSLSRCKKSTELGRASGFDGNLERTQSESTQVQKMVKTPDGKLSFYLIRLFSYLQLELDSSIQIVQACREKSGFACSWTMYDTLRSRAYLFML